MIVAVADLVPKKLLKEGITTELYEGHLDGDKMHLALRETRHLQPAFISRSLVTFLNMVAVLPSDQQLLIMRLMMDVIEGREYKHIELDGAPVVYFPDQRGDPNYDVFLHFGGEEKKQKPVSESASKSPVKSSKKSHEKSLPKAKAKAKKH